MNHVAILTGGCGKCGAAHGVGCKEGRCPFANKTSADVLVERLGLDSKPSVDPTDAQLLEMAFSYGWDRRYVQRNSFKFITLLRAVRKL